MNIQKGTEIYNKREAIAKAFAKERQRGASFVDALLYALVETKVAKDLNEAQQLYSQFKTVIDIKKEPKVDWGQIGVIIGLIGLALVLTRKR